MSSHRLHAILFALSLSMLLAACGSDDDGAACEPACDASRCEVCVGGGCAVSCAADETCDGAGMCVADTDCGGACDSDACETCVAGSCVVSCVAADCEQCDGAGSCVSACDLDACEACDAGSCASVCDIDACERCDGAGSCAPRCDVAACQVCGGNDTCVAQCSASACEQCDGAGGCATTCDYALCETCDGDGGCVVACDPLACEVCGDAGSCLTTCDTAACETCDGAGGCASACDEDACEACDGAGTCASTCDPLLCLECDGAGGCVTTCTSGTVCDGAGACELGCTEPDGYCAGSVVSSIVVPESDCCFDFDDDGFPDNGVALAADVLGAAAGIDLEDLNRAIDEALREGGLALLLEYVGVDNTDDDLYLDLNFYVGADTDDPPNHSDDFTGWEPFRVLPESLNEEGVSRYPFVAARITDGLLVAGPGRVVLPVRYDTYAIDLRVVLEYAFLEATIQPSGTMGYRLLDGRLGGYITGEVAVQAFNDYMADNCGCLGLGGAMVSRDTTTEQWVCAPEPDVHTCDDVDLVESRCAPLAGLCQTGIGALLLAMDLDLDKDGRDDAVSLGAHFTAVGADLLPPL